MGSSSQFFRGVSVSLGFALILGLVSGYQLIGTSRDYDYYLIFFEMIKQEGLLSSFEYRFEPGFVFITYLISTIFSSGDTIYTVIAAFCIFIKIISLNQLNNFWHAILAFTLFYLTRYFTVFEMTVLRVNVAVSIAFFVFLLWDGKKSKIEDLILLCIGVMMHYSAVIFILIYLLKFKTRIQIFIFTGLLYLIIISTKNNFLIYLQDYIFVLSTYDNLTPSTLIPKPMIIDLLFLFFMLFYWRYADFQMQLAIYGVIIGLVFHFSLIEFGLIGGRIREMLSIFFIIYTTRSFHNNVKVIRYGSAIFLVLSGIVYLYVTYIYDPLLSSG